MKTVMDNESAMLELMGISEFFETEYADDDISESILPVVMAGRLYLDEDQKRVIYVFNREIELMNNTILKELKFKNPTSEESIRINKGITAKADKDGGTEIDLGMMMQRVIKAASVISGEPIGVVNRMSRGDMNTLMSVLSFF